MSAPLPKYTGRLIEEAPQLWQWGVLTKEKKHITNLLAALHALKERDVKGSGIIGAYHAWRVVVTTQVFGEAKNTNFLKIFLQCVKHVIARSNTSPTC